MPKMEKFLVWMEERFGRFLLPIDFEQQQDPPDRGHEIKLPAGFSVIERPGLA